MKSFQVRLLFIRKGAVFTTIMPNQSSLFQIFNALVRASAESREAVLQYFSRVISLNIRRGGMQVSRFCTYMATNLLLQVEFDSVASDGFLINLQTILLRFAEPFMDSTYSKVRIITHLNIDFAHSSPSD